MRPRRAWTHCWRSSALGVDWPSVRLGEVMRLEYGEPLPAEARRPGNVVVLGSSGPIGSHDSAVVSGPGLVIGRKGSIGQVTWVDRDFYPIDTTYYAVPIPGRADLRWIYHTLARENLARLNRATGVPGLNRDDVYALTRPLPPLSEQRGIATILDAIDDAIERTEAVIAAAETMRQALLHELLTRGIPRWHTRWKHDTAFGVIPACWMSTSLGSIASFVNGWHFRPEDWSFEGTPIVRIQNLTDPLAAFNRFAGSVEDRYRIKSGDLLVSWSASLDVHVWRGGEAVLNQHIFHVSEDPRLVDRRFLYFALKKAMTTIRERVHGTTMQHITKSPFLSTHVPLPPLPEQREIAEVLESAELLSRVNAQSLATLRRAYAALRRDLLSGRIRAKLALTDTATPRLPSNASTTSSRRTAR